MASLASVAVSVPSFAALNAGVSKVNTTFSTRSSVVCSAAPVESNWSKVAKGLVATGASVLLAASANAATVKLGSDSGELIFVPQELTVAAGEGITFVNNAGFPHNVVIDEGPDGVDTDALSHDEYLNGPGESFTLKLTDKGTYNVICQPHEKGGMKMTINVQ